MADKKYVSELLDKLIALDKAHLCTQYDLGQLLSVFRDDKLYEIVGYDNFAEMVEEELSFSSSTASTYASMYCDFKRLKYTKTEAVKLLVEYGYTNVRKVIRDLGVKIGVRAMRNRIDDLDEHQINFTLTTAELEESHKALKTMGAVQTDHGRYINSSTAFMEMIRVINAPGNKKAA